MNEPITFARSVSLIVCLAFLFACGQAQERHNPASGTDSAAREGAQPNLQTIVRSAPRLALEAVELKVLPPREGWQLGMVSWIAVDPNGVVYMLQRGDKADPIVVTDRDGHVLRSWGKGMYTMPHAIRIDAQGSIWTTDAATSRVYKFTPEGRKLMEIAVGGQPSPCLDPVSNLYRRSTDGTEREEPLTTSANEQQVNDWSTDGTSLAYTEFDPVSGADIWILTMPSGGAGRSGGPGASPAARPFLKTRFPERDAAFSPDGRWIAYESNESGRFEIYVGGSQEIDGSADGFLAPGRPLRDRGNLGARAGTPCVSRSTRSARNTFSSD